MSRRSLRNRVDAKPPKSKIGSLVFLLATIAAYLILFPPWESEQERTQRVVDRVMDKVHKSEQQQLKRAGEQAAAKATMVQRKKGIGGHSLRIKVFTEQTNKANLGISEIFRETEKLIRDIDHANPKSQIASINRQSGKGGVSVSEDIFEIVSRSAMLSEELNGYFDITMLPVIKLWSFDRDNPIIADPQVVKTELAKTGYRQLRMDTNSLELRLSKTGGGLDLSPITGAIVLSLVAEKLDALGIKDYFVFYGSDSIAKGQRDGEQWKVSLQHPKKALFHFGIVTPGDNAVMIANDFSKGFFSSGFRYHPYLDPHTGVPVQGVRSVAVVGPDPLVAEAIAYAAFCAGRKEGIKLLDSMSGYEAVLYDITGKIQTSEGMSKYLTIEESQTNIETKP